MPVKTKKSINRKASIPKWAVIVGVVVLVCLGVYFVYNSYAGDTNPAPDPSSPNRLSGIRKSLVTAETRVANQASHPSTNQHRNSDRTPGSGNGGGGGPSSNSNDDKLYIYNHESGNNPAAVNSSSGACGLGQFLPCHPKIDPCRLIQADYNCQDGKFTAYMQARYGSWSAARAFWDAHHWW